MAGRKDAGASFADDRATGTNCGVGGLDAGLRAAPRSAAAVVCHGSRAPRPAPEPSVEGGARHQLQDKGDGPRVRHRPEQPLLCAPSNTLPRPQVVPRRSASTRPQGNRVAADVAPVRQAETQAPRATAGRVPRACEQDAQRCPRRDVEQEALPDLEAARVLHRVRCFFFSVVLGLFGALVPVVLAFCVWGCALGAMCVGARWRLCVWGCCVRGCALVMRLGLCVWYCVA